MTDLAVAEAPPRPAPAPAPAPAVEPEARTGRVLVLEPGRSSARYLADLWDYRELFLVLAWRDIAVRYKQTAIGILWAVIRPLLTMAILSVVFGRIAALPSDGSAPYVLLVFAGTLPWFLFATALAEGSGSLVANANLVRKVYFPRLIAPVAAAVVAVVDFAISLALLFVVMAAVGFVPDARVLALPLCVLFAVVAALGPTLILAALNVRYRDVRIVVPFVVQFGLYVSPVGFSSEVVPENLRLLFHLNPMAGVIDAFRWALLAGESPLDVPALLVSLAVALVLLAAGVKVFRATERSFADLV